MRAAGWGLGFAFWLLIVLQPCFSTSAEEVLRAPGIVAERWQVINDTTTRVSLFDNRVAVVTVREKGAQTFFRYATLSDGDYLGFLAAISRAVSAIESDDWREIPPGGDLDSVVRFMTASGEIHQLSYSTFSVVDLSVSRLLKTLDDVETIVKATLPGEEALKSWEPRIGDIVELRAGGLAEVVDVREDGLIELEHLEVGIIERVILEKRVQAILRVVPQ